MRATMRWVMVLAACGATLVARPGGARAQGTASADSVYRLARSELNAGSYALAARHFREVREGSASSDRTADAYYWEAFSLSRTGSSGDDRRALELLAERGKRFPDASGRAEARDLETRIRGQLARQGDARAAEELARRAAEIAPAVSSSAASAASAAAAASEAVSAGSGDGCDDEDDDRLMALNALLQMNSEQAVPLLETVLKRRDAGSVCLRRKALFVLSQQGGARTEAVLLQAAGSDPDPRVRESAVFWLSQVQTPRATAALDSILRSSKDEAIRKKAVYALAQQDGEAAGKALRDYLAGPGGSEALKEDVVFWLGQRDREADRSFLRQYYGRATSEALREKILFSVAQSGRAEDARWLLDLARNPQESIELRKKALFWAGQMDAVDVAQLSRLYDGLESPELKERLIFALSQRDEPAAVDKLADIAQNDASPELRKKAIFWLGQSRDPRAAEILMKIIGQ